MWNPFSYISSSQTQLPSAQSVHQKQNSLKQIEQKVSVMHQKYLIQEHAHFHIKIKQFQQLLMSQSHHQLQTQKLIKVFSSLIQSLQQFLTQIPQLKQQYQTNLTKIQNYDKSQEKIEKHNSIVQNMIERYDKERDSVIEVMRAKEMELEGKAYQLQRQLQEKNERIQQLMCKINESEGKIAVLEKEKQASIEQLNLVEVKRLALQTKLSLFLSNTKHQPLSTQPFSPYLKAQNLEIPLSTLTICHQSLCPTILSYLTLHEIHSLSLTSKRIHYTITQSLPKIIYQQLTRQKQQQLNQIKQQSLYFNRVLLDDTDSENMKISAIKYLFFSHKPGTYILNMFQEDITKINDDESFYYLEDEEIKTSVLSAELPESIKNDNTTIDKTKRSWRDYFKSQNNNQPASKPSKTESSAGTHSLAPSSSLKTPQRFSLAELKNSQTFKKVQFQISKSFHFHVFSLKLPKDLQTFGKIMVEQFGQLKKEINMLNSSQKPTIKEWTSKLLTLSKFLYLQSQQLWTLGQNTFSKLIKTQKYNSQLKSELEDMSENHKGLRCLVDQLARHKIQMQKRIWQSERKNGFLKLSTQSIQQVNQRLEKQIQTLRNDQQSQRGKIRQLEKQICSYKQKLLTLSRKHRDKMQQFSLLRQEINNIAWL